MLALFDTVCFILRSFLVRVLWHSASSVGMVTLILGRRTCSAKLWVLLDKWTALCKTADITNRPGQRLKTCYFTHNTLFSELQPLPSGRHLGAPSCKSLIHQSITLQLTGDSFQYGYYIYIDYNYYKVIVSAAQR